MDTQPLKILVLGTSRAFGAGAPSSETAWPHLISAALDREIGVPVVMEIKPYFAGYPNPARYISRCVDETRPDIVAIAAIPVALRLATVANRVDRLLGRRVGRLLRVAEATLTDPRADRRPGRIELRARRVARRVLGAEPPSAAVDPQTAIVEALACLAGYENLTVIVMAVGQLGPWVEAANPRLREDIASLTRFTQDEARRRHFLWVQTGPRDPGDFVRDGMHESPQGHAKTAREGLPVALAAARQALAAGRAEPAPV